MAQSALVKKLRMQSAHRTLMLNAPSGYLESLGGFSATIEVARRPEATYDFVLLFIKDSSEFRTWSSMAREALEYDGLFWLAYPKKSSKVATDLSREVVWQLMEGTGLRPVAQIALDEVWSALRFRPVELVGR